MRRALIVLFALALGACASYSYDRGGYYQAEGHGDYYYSPAPVVPYMGVSWYDPYDALFWGLRYSYFDPFWYPNFHYGVTFFPRYYYGWPFWHAGSYWSWRGYHPYSPYYGSYWDHYYHWHRPSGPRRPLRGGGRGLAGNGPERYGSARNAAERMAAGGRRYAGRQSSMIGDQRGAATAIREPYGRTDMRQRTLEPGILPSSRYAPRQSRAGVDGFQRGATTGSTFRADGRQRGPAVDAYAPTQRADRARFQRGDLAPAMPRSAGAQPPAAQPARFRSPEAMVPSAPMLPATRSAPAMPSRSAAPAPSRSAVERDSPRSRSER